MPPTPPIPARDRLSRLALIGLLINLALAVVKLFAGLLGHSYALIADAVESLADIFGSAVIWGGLRVASLPASDRHPYGYGKAEPLASLVVAVIIFAAGVGIAFEAIHEIITPHHAPAAFTLIVLVVVIVVKEVLYRVVLRAARASGSTAVETDAVHHRADALTSLAALIGISIALIGGKGWEPADDWAALVASCIIIFNSFRLMGPPWRELLDANAGRDGEQARAIATGIPGVRRVQKAFARRSGTWVWIDMHVWVDPAMTVRDAHSLAHAVKDAVRAAMPFVKDVLIHVEPSEPPNSGGIPSTTGK